MKHIDHNFESPSINDLFTNFKHVRYFSTSKFFKFNNS